MLIELCQDQEHQTFLNPALAFSWHSWKMYKHRTMVLRKQGTTLLLAGLVLLTSVQSFVVGCSISFSRPYFPQAHITIHWYEHTPPHQRKRRESTCVTWRAKPCGGVSRKEREQKLVWMPGWVLSLILSCKAEKQKRPSCGHNLLIHCRLDTMWGAKYKTDLDFNVCGVVGEEDLHAK